MSSFLRKCQDAVFLEGMIKMARGNPTVFVCRTPWLWVGQFAVENRIFTARFMGVRAVVARIANQFLQTWYYDKLFATNQDGILFSFIMAWSAEAYQKNNQERVCKWKAFSSGGWETVVDP